MAYFIALTLTAIVSVVVLFAAVIGTFGFVSYCVFENRPKTLLAGLFFFFVIISMAVIHQKGVA